MAPEEISALRLKLGLTKAAFAREIGVRRMTVYRWEGGVSVPKGLSLRALEQLARRPAATASKAVTPVSLDREAPGDQAAGDA